MVVSRRVPTIMVSMAVIALVAMAGLAAQPSTARQISSPTASSCGELLGIGDASVACITVVHVSPDAGTVDLSLNGKTAISGVRAMASSPYVGVAGGTYTLTLTAADDPETTVTETRNVKLAAGRAYELALLGSETAGTLRLTPLAVEPNNDKAAGLLRVVQAIGDAPPLSIQAGADTIATDLPPLDASDYAAVPAGNVSITVTLNGAPQPLVPIRSIASVAGGATTIYLTGTMTNPAAASVLTVTTAGSGFAGTATPGTPGTLRIR